MVWSEVAQFYNNTFENADPRVSEWPMMQSPFPTVIICLSYVYVVKYLGPSIMKNRQPLDIRWLMAFYNFAMVLFNFLIFYHYGIYGWFGSYSFFCQPVDYSNTPEAIGMASTCWWFYISKFIEFTDTIFFIMRKKYNQVSTLHVIHHGIMPLSIWFGLKFTPGGHSTFFAFVNSFVHVLMYTYYGLSAFGPQMNKYLWWKKYMTTFQMVQFIMIFTHSFQLLIFDCNYPRGFMWWIGFHAVLFWFLFADFYRKAYDKRRQATAKFKNGHANGIAKNGNGCHNGYRSHGDVVVNGNGVLLEGGNVVVNGNGVLLEGGNVVVNGNGVVMDGGNVAVNGNGVLLESGKGVVHRGLEKGDSEVVANGNGKICSVEGKSLENGNGVVCNGHDLSKKTD